MLDDIMSEDRATNAQPDSAASANVRAVDRSKIFQRLRHLGVWPIAELFIAEERQRLRLEGQSRRQAGDSAWQLADEVFVDEAVRLGTELHGTLPFTPPGLTADQAGAWRIAVVTLSVATQRSPTLIPTANALIGHTRLRQAMELVGQYELERSNIEASWSPLVASKDTCVQQITCIAETLAGIETGGLSNELIDELSELLTGLNTTRDVFAESWSSTSFALPPG